jgi:hypothetical protein
MAQHSSSLVRSSDRRRRGGPKNNLGAAPLEESGLDLRRAYSEDLYLYIESANAHLR